MTAVLAYCALALLILVAVVSLLCARRAETVPAVQSDQAETAIPWEESDFSLAEQIFDRADYDWLRDQVGFSALAESLLRTRTQMALQWLRAVRRSFDKLARTPSDAPVATDPATTRESWNLLSLTLRFHLIVGYAILIVRVFGPYHRLIPSFGWMPSLFARPSAPDRYKPA